MNYCPYEVKKKMMSLIAEDGSMVCLSVVKRLCEMIKVCHENDEPITALMVCGVIFEDAYFIMHRKSLACALIVPEKILTKRLDQAGMTITQLPQANANDILKFNRPPQECEVRVYAMSTDCKRLRELLSQTGMFFNGKRRSADASFSPEFVKRDQFVPVRIPKKIALNPSIPLSWKPDDVPVVFTDGNVSEYMIVKKKQRTEMDQLPKISILDNEISELMNVV